MRKKYYAHSDPKKPCKAWHSLEDHLQSCAGISGLFAGKFGADDWARLAGLWHDLGKYAPEFQKKLIVECRSEGKGPVSRVNHSTAGAIFAMERFSLRGVILAYLIAGHHAGLPDWEGDETGRSALSRRISDADLLDSVRENIPDEILNWKFPASRPVKGTDPAFWIRMLFSCLVDADYLDTEEFFSPQNTKNRWNYPKISALLELFSKYMKGKISDSKVTPVNRLRREILDRCLQYAEAPPGVFSLTVPTGGGKTLSSLGFALYHAEKHDKRRIIYVIPYTSIIEQTADQFRKIFGQSVIEHHSNLDGPESADESSPERLACENWEAPVIVTTAVQFFESLFASRTSRCRKLHNIVNSVVVLDEAQLLPPEYLNPILFSLDELRKNYGVTILLTTATQPAFYPQPHFHFKGVAGIREIISDPESLHKEFKRVEVKTLKPLSMAVDWEEIAETLRHYQSVLCIVNRRDDCRKLWKLMPSGTFHLSALMCGAHRSRQIAEIKERLNAGVPTRVISTQLVEAGVDLDFPVVFRALCGLDSLAQAAGRCNREGVLKKGEFFVFRPPSEPPIGHLRQAAVIGKSMLKDAPDDPFTPERFSSFFEQLFWLQGDRLDAKNIMADLAPDRDFRFSFRTAASKFKIIDDTRQEPVIVVYGEGADFIRELEWRKPDRHLYRKLQRYVVNLPRYLHEKLLNEGAIRQLHTGIYVQGHSAMYDDETGFNQEKSMIYNADDLIA